MKQRRNTNERDLPMENEQRGFLLLLFFPLKMDGGEGWGRKTEEDNFIVAFMKSSHTK